MNLNIKIIKGVAFMTENTNLADINISDNIDKIDKLVEKFKAHQCMMAALESGLFDFLYEKGESTREEIIASIKLKGMFSKSFLGALVNLGFIKLNKEKYSNTEIANTFLSQASKSYQGNWLKLNTGSKSKWNNLTETIIDNELLFQDESLSEYYEIKGFEERSARGELKPIVSSITSWNEFEKAKKVLEIGDEKGLYSVALCQINPQIKATVLSDSKHLESIKKYIEKNNLQNQIQVLDKEIESVELASDYDIVLVSHFLYRYRKDLESMFNNIHNRARKNGLVVFNHWFCGPGCQSTENIQEIDKSLFSGGHPLCHFETFPDKLRKNNFDVMKTLDIPSYNGISKLHITIKR